MEFSRSSDIPPDEEPHGVPTWAKVAVAGTAGVAFAAALAHEATNMDVSTVPYNGPAVSVEAGTPVYEGPSVARQCGEVAESFTATPTGQTNDGTTITEFYTFQEGLAVDTSSALTCQHPMIFAPDVELPGE